MISALMENVRGIGVRIDRRRRLAPLRCYGTPNAFACCTRCDRPMDRVAAMDKALGHQPRRGPDAIGEVAAPHHRAQARC